MTIVFLPHKDKFGRRTDDIDSSECAYDISRNRIEGNATSSKSNGPSLYGVRAEALFADRFVVG